MFKKLVVTICLAMISFQVGAMEEEKDKKDHIQPAFLNLGLEDQLALVISIKIQVGKERSVLMASKDFVGFEKLKAVNKNNQEMIELDNHERRIFDQLGDRQEEVMHGLIHRLKFIR